MKKLDTLVHKSTRYKRELWVKEPFSKSLNRFLEKFFGAYQHLFEFVDEDDFDDNDIQGTFEKHKELFKTTGKIRIWTGASDHTIFGNARSNHLFRAWHDYIHLTHNLGYSFAEEVAVAQIQMSMLTNSFDKLLVNAEIVGQGLYFQKHGKFPEDQRSFILKFLINGTV